MQEHVAAERERLAAAKAELLQDRQLIDERIANIDDEMRAISAYEAAKLGKTAKPARVGTTRARRGSRREALLELIRQSDGLSRGEILDALGLKGDKSGEMSVSNALTAMIKHNAIYRHGGKYHAVAMPLSEAAE